MKFIEEIKKLQEEFKGHVVLVKCGIFYTAIGKDAIILHGLLGMHLICMKEKLCKSGVLDKNIDKFIKEMDERNLSFVICDYDKNKIGNKITPICIRDNKVIEEQRECLDCEACDRYKKYMSVEKLLEEQEKGRRK